MPDPAALGALLARERTLQAAMRELDAARAHLATLAIDEWRGLAAEAYRRRVEELRIAVTSAAATLADAELAARLAARGGDG